MIRIRLTKKLAAVLNGIDVSAFSIGDVLDLPDSAAKMMIAERWAEPTPDATTVDYSAFIQHSRQAHFAN